MSDDANLLPGNSSTAAFATLSVVLGDEIVQLYIRDEVASITRPVKELKGFERISLKVGEKKKVNLTISPKDLRFYNREMKFVVENGIFKFWVGTNSAEGLESNFEVI